MNGHGRYMNCERIVNSTALIVDIVNSYNVILIKNVSRGMVD